MGFNLLTRRDSFLPLFSRQGDVLRGASRLLTAEAASCDQSARSLAEQVLELEHRGDDLVREIVTGLNSSFITRLEPEVALLLASRLDDVLDGIEDAAYRIAAYRISGLPRSAVRLCEIIEACVALIAQAINVVEDTAPMTEYYAEINRLEHEADGVVRSGIAELLGRESDVLLVIKVKEIYEFLEGTVDRCEDVADVLRSISTKKC